MKSFIRAGILVFALGSITFACTDDYFEFDKIKTDDWRPEMAVPAVNSSLTLEDIVVKKDSNNLIQVNPDNGVLEIVYNGSVFSTVGGQFVNIPNQSFNEGIGLPANLVPPSPVPAGLPPVQYATSVDIAYNATVEVDSLLLKEGTLVFTMESTFQHNVDVAVEFPGIRDLNGQSLTITQSLPASNGSTPSVRSVVEPLNDKMIDMTDGGTSFNTINADVDLTINLIQGNNISANDRFNIIGELRSLDFKEFSGFIGQESLQLERDTVNVGMFKNFRSGEFVIANPTLEIDIINSFGLPAHLNFQELKAVNPDQIAQVKDINLPIDPATGQTNIRELLFPTDKGVSITKLRLDTTDRSSNISEIISFLLKEIVYQTRVEFNPNGPTAGRNFFSDTSGIGLNVFLKIPFEGRARNFFLVDTIPMDLSVSSDLESGTIRTIMDNGFPVDVKMQMVFTDSLYNPIDSLYEQGAEPVIPAAPTDQNGDATGSSKNITDTGITQDRFNKLSDGRYAIIVALLNTTDADIGRNVRFKPEYNLDIGVSVRAKVIVN